MQRSSAMPIAWVCETDCHGIRACPNIAPVAIAMAIGMERALYAWTGRDAHPTARIYWCGCTFMKRLKLLWRGARLRGRGGAMV